MKLWKKLKGDIPAEAKPLLDAYMAKRPRKMPRHKWMAQWMNANGYLSSARGPVSVSPTTSAKVPKKQRRVTFVSSDEFLQSFEWRQLRMVVIKKRGARCECCGASPKDGVTVINVDHVQPRRDFPALALEESNLQVLCGPCNHGKGNWDRTDWRDDQPVQATVGPRLVPRESVAIDMTDEEACRILESTAAVSLSARDIN